VTYPVLFGYGDRPLKVNEKDDGGAIV